MEDGLVLPFLLSLVLISNVLILVVMEDGLVLTDDIATFNSKGEFVVLILVVMEDGLVLTDDIATFNSKGEFVVLILVVMEDGLVPYC